MSTLIDDLAENEPLMAALGRIALRSAELGEAVDDVTRQLDSEKGKKSRSLMLGKKLALAKEAADVALSCNPELYVQIISFFEHAYELIRQDRNSPIHSTFLAYDVEGVVIKWDTRLGPQLIRIDDLNQSAEKFKGKTKRLRQFLHEIRNFQALWPLGERT